LQYTKKNEGVTSTRNAGSTRAYGKYILFFDRDDYIKKNSIEKLMNTAQKK